MPSEQYFDGVFKTELLLWVELANNRRRLPRQDTRAVSFDSSLHTKDACGK